MEQYCICIYLYRNNSEEFEAQISLKYLILQICATDALILMNFQTQ